MGLHGVVGASLDGQQYAEVTPPRPVVMPPEGPAEFTGERLARPLSVGWVHGPKRNLWAPRGS